MSNIIDLDYYKYRQTILNNRNFDYTNYVENIQYDESYSDNIIKVIECLIYKTEQMNINDICLLMTEIKNANVINDVSQYITELYNFERYINVSMLSDNEESKIKQFEIQITFPPQVLKYFKSFLEEPQLITKFDVIAILAIIKDQNISSSINEFITNLRCIPINTDEDTLKSLFEEDVYSPSLFKKYIN